MSLMTTSTASAALTPASAPRTRSPARDTNWNKSSSMGAVLSHSPVALQRAIRDVPKNPNEKAVCSPKAIPTFTKKSATVEHSLIFTPLGAGENTHRVVKTSMHTDPFEGNRQALNPRPMYMRYGSPDHQQPHPAGRCHLRDVERDNKGFVSVSGKVSYGGRRHTAGAPAQFTVADAPTVQPSRSPARRAVSPLSGMSVDFPMRTTALAVSAHPQRSPLRKRSPVRDQPTLQGVLKPDPKPHPVGLISKPVWLGSSTSEKNSGSSGIRSCAPTAAVAAVSLPNGALDAVVVKQRKHYISNRVVVATKAPYHTTTPRQPASNTKSLMARPYC